ncbi:MAG: hypothetical protein N3A65_09760 [candidate division WOR-3 bacterium]|nr:hypothetical protein [candidate division WOR-3 bacterium]
MNVECRDLTPFARKFKNITMPQLRVIQLPDKNFIVNFPAEDENIIYQVKLDSEGNVIGPTKIETATPRLFDDLKSGHRFVQISYDYYPSSGRLRDVYVYFIGFDDEGMLYCSKHKVK